MKSMNKNKKRSNMNGIKIEKDEFDVELECEI